MRGEVLQEHLLTPHTADAAVWRYSPCHPKLPHFHGQLEFLVVKRGSIVERIGNHAYRACAKQLLWHLPGLGHELVSASSDLDLRIVHVEPDVVLSAAGAVDLTALRLGAGSFNGWIRELSRSVAGRPVVELASGRFDAIFGHCERTSDAVAVLPEATPRPRRAVSAALEATFADHDDRTPMSLVTIACCRLLEDASLERSQLARELDVSEGYLSRRFRAELGLSFREQRARLRLVRFVSHVVREKRRLLEAALLAGFGSYSQLHRVFVEQVGMSPRAYLAGGGRNRRALVPA